MILFRTKGSSVWQDCIGLWFWKYLRRNNWGEMTVLTKTDLPVFVYFCICFLNTHTHTSLMLAVRSYRLQGQRSKIDSLPVSAADETIHDLPENLGSPAEEMPPLDDLSLPTGPQGPDWRWHHWFLLVHLPIKQWPRKISSGVLCQSLIPGRMLLIV